MKNVQGFSKCSTANEKFIWNEEDSIYGVDIPAWIQIINEADCKNEECADYCKEKFGGAYIKGKNKNKCYSYQILHGICLVLKYNPLKVFPFLYSLIKLVTHLIKFSLDLSL